LYEYYTAQQAFEARTTAATSLLRAIASSDHHSCQQLGISEHASLMQALQHVSSVTVHIHSSQTEFAK
jgi:hypothetical protein